MNFFKYAVVRKQNFYAWEIRICKHVIYCNGVDQSVARQQLCKHGTTNNNRGSCVFRVRRDVTQQWIETT
jgi:hypothetical protein